MFHDTQVLRNPVPVPFEVFERIIELSGLQDIHPTPTQETTPSSPLLAPSIDAISSTECPGGLDGLIQPHNPAR
jgi:hypothetical protein